MFPTHLGDYVDGQYVDVNNLTAGGSDDGAEQDGNSIDRQDFYSGVLAVPITATLADTETATLAVTLQESADGSNWSDLGSDYQPDDLVLTGDTGGTTETGLLEQDINLKGTEQYVRAQITVTMSNTTTDTAAYGAYMALGGSVEKPV